MTGMTLIEEGWMETAMERETRQLSPVLENYLEVIFVLENNDGAARASAIADGARVSRSTVTSTLKTLKSMGLVEYSPYSLIRLTDEGRRIGRDIYHRHLIFQEFFESILQMDRDMADRIACNLEHAVPPEIIRRLGQFVLFMKTRPEMWKNWQDVYLREEIVKHSHGAFGKTDER